MRIWFDMDGTIADLYAVENWLPKLREYDPSPYAEAKPLLNLSSLARILNRLTKQGYEIGIISWLSRDPNPEYGQKVREAKLNWLAKHLPSVKWNEIKIVPYGTSKSQATKTQPSDILFDDEERNRTDWEQAEGKALEPAEIINFLRSIKQVAGIARAANFL